MPAILAAWAGPASGIVLDDFGAAVATKQPPGVIRSAVGSTTVADAGVGGVIGGVRQVTVVMGAASTTADYIDAGVSTAFAVFDYWSTGGADGRFELMYDKGAAGLDADLSFAAGIRVVVTAADADAPAYVVTVVLVDNAARTGSSSQTITVSGARTIEFPFAGFGLVDVAHLFSVKVSVDPQRAGDLRLGPIETFSAVLPTPTPSPGFTQLPTQQIEVPTATPTATDTGASTATATATNTETAIATSTPTAIATDTVTAVPTDTATAVATKSSTATFTGTATPTNTPTQTATETLAPAKTATPTPTNAPPDCSQAIPSLSRLWPPNHTFRQVSVDGVTDPDGDPVTITVTSIFQDEPIKKTGNLDGCPDGLGIGISTALLRAERGGSLDGRVYHVGFQAADGKGGQCAGAVTVCVPHEGSRSATCVDQGPLVNSTGPCN